MDPILVPTNQSVSSVPKKKRKPRKRKKSSRPNPPNLSCINQPSVSGVSITVGASTLLTSDTTLENKSKRLVKCKSEGYKSTDDILSTPDDNSVQDLSKTGNKRGQSSLNISLSSLKAGSVIKNFGSDPSGREHVDEDFSHPRKEDDFSSCPFFTHPPNSSNDRAKAFQLLYPAFGIGKLGEEGDKESAGNHQRSEEYDALAHIIRTNTAIIDRRLNRIEENQIFLLWKYQCLV